MQRSLRVLRQRSRRAAFRRRVVFRRQRVGDALRDRGSECARIYGAAAGNGRCRCQGSSLSKNDLYDGRQQAGNEPNMRLNREII